MPCSRSSLVVAKIFRSWTSIASIFSCCADRAPRSACNSANSPSKRLDFEPAVPSLEEYVATYLSRWAFFQLAIANSSSRSGLWLASDEASDCNLFIRSVINSFTFGKRIFTNTRTKLHFVWIDGEGDVYIFYSSEHEPMPTRQHQQGCDHVLLCREEVRLRASTALDQHAQWVKQENGDPHGPHIPTVHSARFGSRSPVCFRALPCPTRELHSLVHIAHHNGRT